MKKTLLITATVTVLALTAVLTVLWNIVVVDAVFVEKPEIDPAGTAAISAMVDPQDRRAAAYLRESIENARLKRAAATRTVVIKRRLLTGEVWKEYL
jgi:hypothetical protein